MAVYEVKGKKWRCGLCGEVIEGDQAELWWHWYFEHAGSHVTWETFLSELEVLEE